jgi:L-ascorbate metabolism protein UlaG (beta-lactamase superfamily)
MDTRSDALLAQVDALAVPPGQLAIWALGQAGFIFKGGDTVAYIDPFLSDMPDGRRRFPPPVAPAAVRHAGVIFATHEHLDHADGATLGPLMAASPQATLVTSPQGRQIALEADVPTERIVTPRLGERAELGGLAYTAIPAMHGADGREGYQFELDEQGRSRWMGFKIEINGVTLYHAGDTVVFPELLDAVRDTRPDIAMLPINGRDHYRERHGIVGNLWPGEAVELAKEIGARLLIGYHNDLFAGNRVAPGLLWDELDRRAPFMRCHTLQPGELYLFAG